MIYEDIRRLLPHFQFEGRFEDAAEINRTEGGIRNMCDVLDRIENKGREEGRLEGREEGREEGRLEGREEERVSVIKTLMETLKLTAQQAMDALKIPPSEQPKYAAKLS